MILINLRSNIYEHGVYLVVVFLIPLPVELIHGALSVL